MVTFVLLSPHMGTNVRKAVATEIDDLNGSASPILQQPVVESKISDPSIESNDLELRTIIRQFDELPEVVRLSEFTDVYKRRLDQELMKTLLTQQRPPNCRCDWELHIQQRKKSLVRYRGKILYCVFIRLAGVHYTIEVDLKKKAVVHWEWQIT